MELILIITVLISYEVFLLYGALPIIRLIEYANFKQLDVFGKKYGSYFFAISDPVFMCNLWSASNIQISDNPELEIRIQIASKRYRLTLYVSALLIVSLFVLSVLGVFR